MVRRSIAPAIGVAALALLVMGCSSRPAAEQKGPSQTGASATQTGAPATGESAPSNQSQAGTVSGIVVVGCRLDGVTVVTGYDPATHQQTFQRQFSPPQGNCASKFDPTFTKIAVTLSDTTIGYVDENSAVHQLTPARGSGFADAPPNQRGPVFNPVTGALWFYDGNTKSYATVDLQNPANVQRQSPTVWGNPDPAESFVFSADGKVVMSLSRVTTSDGRREFRSVVGYDTYVMRDRSATEDTPLTAVPGTKAHHCEPVTVLDDTSFLCTGDGTLDNPQGLYKMTVNVSARSVTQQALLPEAGFQNVSSVCVDPARQRVAFIALDLSTETSALYVVPLTGGTPTKVVDLDAKTYRVGLGAGSGLALAAWRQ